MKKLKAFLIIVMITTASYCQTNINYSSFDAWRQNSSTKKMEHIKTIYNSGYIEIDNERATAIIYNSKLNQKELFQFTSFRKVENGHYLGFGKVDNQQMLTFIPEDSLLLLKVNDVVVMQFSLKQSDIFKLKKEFGSNVVNVNADYNEDNSSFNNILSLEGRWNHKENDFGVHIEIEENQIIIPYASPVTIYGTLERISEDTISVKFDYTDATPAFYGVIGSTGDKIDKNQPIAYIILKSKNHINLDWKGISLIGKETYWLGSFDSGTYVRE